MPTIRDLCLIRNSIFTFRCEKITVPDVQLISSRANQFSFFFIVFKIFRSIELFSKLFMFFDCDLMAVCILKPWVAFSEFRIRNICIQFFLIDKLQVLFAEESCISNDFGLSEIIFSFANYL